VVEMIEYWTTASAPSFRLRPSTILDLHRSALEGLSHYAGNYRPAGIEIGGSKHTPVPAHLVPQHVEELCDYVNDNWTRSPVRLSSYVMWRLNWIHPFTDGNGRTSRALAYLILCCRLGYRLPGTNTLPEQIAQNKRPYYLALEAADGGDLSPLEDLVAGAIAQQLLEIHEAARSDEYRESRPPTLH
ncbi:MAG TPA: Fic family protein, partial [Rhodothermales bacterium]|nr:Fic family protein [Rhodothermales bacterium]